MHGRTWQSGDTLTLYYNEYGVLQLMAVLPKTTAGAAHSFVYGLATSRRIPAEIRSSKTVRRLTRAS